MSTGFVTRPRANRLPCPLATPCGWTIEDTGPLLEDYADVSAHVTIRPEQRPEVDHLTRVRFGVDAMGSAADAVYQERLIAAVLEHLTTAHPGWTPGDLG